NRGFTRALVGVPRDEGDAILRYLYEHMENPLFQCRFRWRENSIAFWDNRCVQHRAMWDYWPHTRSGNRVTVAGGKPYYLKVHTLGAGGAPPARRRRAGAPCFSFARRCRRVVW